MAADGERAIAWEGGLRVAAAAGSGAGYFECVDPSPAYFGALGELVVIVGELQHAPNRDVASTRPGAALAPCGTS